jgi:tetratricopeptide (TPR) repeat protein
LSVQQAVACAGSWGAGSVIYGSITVQPSLRWTITLRDVASGAIIFEDTLVGEPEDLLDAPGDAARAIADALHLTIDAEARIDRRETERLDALLTYLQAVDQRPQHGITPGDTEIVRRLLLRALALDPDFRAPASLLIADIFTGEPAGSLDAVLATMDNMGAYGINAGAALARALDEQGRTEQADRLASAVLAREPQQEIALATAAQQAYRSGHMARARALVHAWLDVQPDHPAAHELLGNLLAAMDRFPGAAQHWTLALEQDPDQPGVLMRLGSYLTAAGEYPRAYELLKRAATLGEATAEALYQLAVSAYRLGLMSEAIAALHLALRQEPDFANAHVLMARSYLRHGRADLARIHDTRALELRPKYWPSALAIGQAALSRGQAAEALDAFTLVVQARPDLPEALLGLGSALTESDRAEEAIPVLLRANELRIRDPDILCALAVAYMRTGKRALAEQTFAMVDALSARNAARSQRAEIHG